MPVPPILVHSSASWISVSGEGVKAVSDITLTINVARIEDVHGRSGKILVSAGSQSAEISISQSGVLTVKKDAEKLKLRSIRVTARPARYMPYDDTELCGSFTAYITDPIKTIDIVAYKIFALDPDTPTFSTVVKVNDNMLQCDNGGKQIVSVTSSNPKLVRAWLERNTVGEYNLYLEASKSAFTAKKATVTITVKANDGFGKSASFKVTLQNP